MPRKLRTVAKSPAKAASSLLEAFAPVRRAAVGLPEVEEGTSYGTPSLRAHGKFLARIREDGESLVLRADFDSRDAMLRARPHAFYITEHYRDYPAVLVRLSAVSGSELRELLTDCWRLVVPKSIQAKYAGLPARAAGRPCKETTRRGRDT